MSQEHAASRGEHPFRDIYTVSRLNREARTVLEGGFPLLWVEGEISNLARPASGHLYFSLKDPAAQVRCAMFRNRNLHLGFEPANGQQVLVRARVSLYEARGEFQLIVEHMEEAGAGALRRAFEALKARLEKEGLFAPEHKRPLPAHPRCVGVITSPSGAAVRDILTTLRRRFPALPVIVYPVPVQGEGAAEAIAAALHRANERRECDVLILARGGGSLEDLWAFNEEVVARAIHASAIPVVTGVGHEIDFTIADFAADHRAPTPTAAAELVSPDQQAWRRRLDQLTARLDLLMARRLEHLRERLAWLAGRLREPRRRLQEAFLRLDELDLRLHRAMDQRLRHEGHRLATLRARLLRHHPEAVLAAARSRCALLAQRLAAATRDRLGDARHRLELAARGLEAVSPLATLARGYAIVSDPADGTVIRAARGVRPGQRVEARLHEGRLLCRVEETRD